MPDTGRQSLRFGFFPEPRADELPALVRRVQFADDAGLDLVGIQDHPYQRRFVDALTLLSHLSAVTSTITLMPDVANLPLRGPVMLAKQSATIDLLCGGRFELGLGAGAMWDAVAAMGGPRRSPGESLAALSEAIDVIRALWSSERGLRAGGEHYSLAGAHGGPQPAHDIGIFIGGYGDRMMRIIGEKADGWVPSMSYLPPSKLPDKAALLEEAAVASGRDPGTIRRIYNVSGQVAATVDEREDAIVGPAQYWADRLVGLAESHALDTFIFWPAGDVDTQLELFTGQVAPLARTYGWTPRG